MKKPLPTLPPRDTSSHKGTFGSLGVIGGHRGKFAAMFGGTALAAQAALRTGIGKCTLAMPESLLADGIKLIPQAIGLSLREGSRGLKVQESTKAIDWLARHVDCLLIGPAFGSAATQRRLVRQLLSQEKPAILDAGAINAVAFSPDIWAGGNPNTILTPHLKEFERLAEGFDLQPTDDLHKQADHLAGKLETIIVLKSSNTYITDGKKHTYMFNKPNPALAAAGSGDVLAGIISGFVTQYYPKDLSLFDCALAGVAVHNQAGQLWRDRHGDRGLIMPELVDLIPVAIQKYSEGQDTKPR
jgi:NAD(P)H-hydrate epimerase